jgi:hypothetical protein
MSEFTQLIASSPIVTPPIPEIVYDKLWIDTITITSPIVNKISLYCKMIPCRDNLETGEKELKQDLKDGDVKIIIVDNVWDIVGTNPKFGMAMEMIFQSINDYGKNIGVIYTEPVVEPPVEQIITEI